MRIRAICIGIQLIILAFLGANIYQSNASLNGETGTLEYFFFRDVKLGNTVARVWGNWTWNKSVENGGLFDGYSRFCSSGGADLFYNESGGKGWGGAIFLQGTHPHTFRDSILGGINRQSAVLEEYISFKRTDEIPENEFILSAKVMVHERNYTGFGDSVEAVSNVGIDLMFSYDDADYHDPDWNHSVAVHADVILSRVWWDNENKIHHNEIGESSVAPFGYDADYHLPLIRGKIETLGVWNTFEIDLGEIVETIFNLLQGVNTIHFRGVQVYIDGISSYTRATYSWVFTRISSEVFEPVFQRGISYATYANMGPSSNMVPSNIAYGSVESDESLECMKRVGVEWVAINVVWWQEKYNSTKIYSDSATTPTNESIAHAIEKAHSLSMKVMLKPMIDLSNETDPDPWRGKIEPSTAWFQSYANFINFSAEIAEKYNVQILCIGTELNRTVSWPQWRDIISGVRHRYSGLLTYAADWWKEYDEYVKWWNDLDYVGINAYFPLSAKNDPTIAEMKSTWENIANYLDWFYSEVNRPIIFTEIGYQAVNGTNIQPWNYSLMNTNELDIQEQADCYEAAFQSLWNRTWLCGMYWWYWQTDPNPTDTARNSTLVTMALKDYTPQNKPTQGVITHWYSPDQNSYSTLLEQIERMNSTLQLLLNNITDLQGEYDSLLTTINNMQEQINSLNLTCDKLTSEQEAITNELSSVRNLIYVFIATTIILTIATAYLATKTRVPKAKT